MSTSAASSLVLLSLNPKLTLSLCNPIKPTSVSFLSSSFSSLRLQGKTIVSVPTSILPSRFIPNVAISSEFGHEEEVSSDGDEPNFSPDLKLFVGSLPFSVDSEQLASLFQNPGTVEVAEVIYDKVTGRSRGFGFVTMSSIEEVEAAARQFNGYELDGRPVRVNSGPPPPREPSLARGGGGRGGESFVSSNRLLASGNLSWGIDNLALENLFSEQGKVVDARVVYGRESGRSRGFDFVTYSSAEEV